MTIFTVNRELALRYRSCQLSAVLNYVRIGVNFGTHPSDVAPMENPLSLIKIWRDIVGFPSVLLVPSLDCRLQLFSFIFMKLSHEEGRILEIFSCCFLTFSRTEPGKYARLTIQL